ncbi:hypothetical protein PCE1_004864 [Barthelona sp. PCE]
MSFSDDEVVDQQVVDELTLIAKESVKDKGFESKEELLLEMINEISIPKEGFKDVLAVTVDTEIVLEDVNDDLQRESSFYQQALSGYLKGRAQCAKEDIPCDRPRDYFAEMLKSDDHMARIKKRLISEEAKITKAQERRQQREFRKKGKKKMRAESITAQNRRKKETKSNVQRLRDKYVKKARQGR